MKLLLLGSQGQVGWELQRALAPLGLLTALGHADADFEDLAKLRATVRSVDADVIVNAAAYTAVDKAESDAMRAQRINADAVAVLAEEAKIRSAWLVHYSTDYVFDGSKESPYVEDDAPNPLSVYGRTKLDGENAIRASGCRHLVFRTSWVFAARGANFAKTMLRLAADRDELKVVGDQFGAPTSAELIADATALCLYRVAHDHGLQRSAAGTYHLVAGGEASWHHYAAFVVAEARRLGWTLRVADSDVRAITTDEYPLPAPRPKNSRLSTQKLSATFGIALPDWSHHVRRLLAEITAREGK